MKQSKAVLRAGAACIAVVALALGGCSSGGGAAGENSEPVSGGTARFGLSLDPPCFDPHYTGTIMNYTVARNVIDSLLYWKPDGTFAPWLAESYRISEDQLTYTFTLRKDVTFSNGEVFDAAAVKANYDFILDPANATNAAKVITSIRQVNVIDPHTVEFQLSKVDSGLLRSLSSVRAGFLAPSVLPLKDKLCKDTANLIGTGPFTIEQYNPGQDVTLVKNQAYNWAPESADHQGPAYLDEVVFTFLPETSARTGALQSDQVDIIDSVQSYDVPLFEDTEGFEYLVGYDTSTSFGFNLNAGRFPTDDIRVRKALRDGFDVDAVVSSLYQGHVSRNWSWAGADSPYYDPSLVGQWGNKIDEANKLLDEAGWTQRDGDGYRVKDGKRLTVSAQYIAEAVRDQRDILIQSIQAELKKNIGLELLLDTPDSGTFYSRLYSGNYGIYPNIWTGADLANNVTTYIHDWLYKYAAQKPAEVVDVNTLALRAVGTLDEQQRIALIHEVQRKMVLEHALFVPLSSGAFQIATSSRVHGIGFEPDSLTVGSFHGVWIG
ncbi:ABC transporter substrate-binding protein [Nocardia higoensis]|uniref:ABC transporter substrate-binding protein n=1 Tax=Nocardia higoensis TaxID=228599 RepID=UPI0002F83569|nr:ABC transporter substrate-binding protein [Nocardia higoensis]